MTDDLSAFTRRIEACRKRWHKESLDYVLRSAQILTEARNAAKTKRRWQRWLREDLHMNPTTASRHMRVAGFMNRNVALKQQCASLSISKVYALSKVAPHAALSLLKKRGEEISRMSDIQFVRSFRTSATRHRRTTLPNLLRSTFAAMFRLEQVVARWRRPHRTMPAQDHAQLMHRLNAVLREAGQLIPARKMAL